MSYSIVNVNDIEPGGSTGDSSTKRSNPVNVVIRGGGVWRIDGEDPF